MTDPKTQAAVERLTRWAARFGPDIQCPIGAGPNPHDIRAVLADLSGQPAAPYLPADVVALNWLAARPNLELSHGYDDPEDEGSWRVHRVNGGINDREWTLIGLGSTPLYAIQSAMEKDAKPVTMLTDQGWLTKHTATDPDGSVEGGPDVFADWVAGAEHDVSSLFASPEEAARELAKGDAYAALSGIAPPPAVAEQTGGEE